MIVEGLLPTRRSAWFTFSWRMTGVRHRLPALPFIAVRFEITSQQPMCSLPGLNNQVDDLLPLPLVNRYFERLSARGSPEKGDGQIAAYVCLRFRELGRLQELDQLSCLSGRLESEEELAHICFVGEDQVVGFLSPEPGFDGMQPRGPELERIRNELFLVEGALHLRVRELGEDAVLERRSL